MKTKLLIFIFIITWLPGYSQVFSDDFLGLDSIQLVYISGERVGGTITDMYNDGDSVLYLGGIFNSVNGNNVNSIFAWDSQNARYFDNDNNIEGSLNCIHMYKDTLYVGTSFRNFNDLARSYFVLWNGSSWQGHRLGRIAGHVWDMCPHEGKLCIAGQFKYIGDQIYDKIALYDGESWKNIGHFSEIPTFAVESINGELYAAGQTPMGVRHYLGGTEWQDHRVFDDHVYCLKADTFNTFLYAGGYFSRINGEISRGIAMWDGFKWNAMDYGYGGVVSKKGIAIHRGDVYTGHSYTYNEATNQYTFFIARWDGEKWDSIGGNFSSTIQALDVFQDEIYIGGYFKNYNGHPSKGLVKLTMPDNECDYIKPRINTFSDTIYLQNGIEVSEYNRTDEVRFFNNNPYVDSWEWDFGDGNFAYEKDPIHTYTDTGTYIVSIKVVHEGCEKSYSKNIRIEDDPLSLNIESIDRFFDIYPNPSEGNFTAMLLLTDYKEAELRITTTNGHLKTIVPISSEETQINTAYFKSGAYICSLFVDNKLILSERIILK